MVPEKLNPEYACCFALHSHFESIPNWAFYELLSIPGCQFDNDALLLISQTRNEIQIRMVHLLSHHLLIQPGSNKGYLTEIASLFNKSLGMVDCIKDESKCKTNGILDANSMASLFRVLANLNDAERTK
jgi:hypothetical protein